MKFRISQAGLDLFLQEGFEKVTVDKVAEAAGVSRRTVFRYFRVKQEIPFPDHATRLRLQKSVLDAAGADDDAIEVLIRATRTSFLDFLEHEEIVIARYRLARIEPQVREREIVENARYVANSRAFLRSRLGEGAIAADVWAVSFEAVHRAALREFAISGRAADALSQFDDNCAWTAELFRSGWKSLDLPQDSMIVAVLPATAQNLRRIEALRSQVSRSFGADSPGTRCGRAARDATGG